ncbi:hypothetical protein COMNV_00279 [Commensalibacter sp. Nvir]|uniref:DUF948 domain-containing protein n=1 Tax=Commensalibacter sp. Nvir TaxID=3069817 RepID=UPI002D5E2497|nr:hypothetical protein COMNV_00279 [Commensalibacter sp. Nvir]
MSFFFPDWIPGWLQILLIVAVVFLVVCYLLMPFAVFGIKGRLRYLNQHLEDMQAQLNVVLKRLPETKNSLDVRLHPLSVEKDEQGSVVEQPKSSKTYNKPISPVMTRPKTGYYDELQKRNKSISTPEPKIDASQVKPSSQQSFDAYPKKTFSNDRKSDQIFYNKTKDHIYDPPTLEENKKSGESVKNNKKRIEPILRWPPG